MTAFTIVGSTSHALTGTAYTYQPDSGAADSNDQNTPKPWLVRVYANRKFHVRMDGQAATTNDFPVDADWHGVLLSVPPGGELSVIKATGEADGTVWFSHVKRN